MPDALPVHVNRDALHSLEVPEAFETDGSFDVAIRNHGEAIHVHLHLDDALSEVATIDANNHYVGGNDQRAVRVTVDGESPAHGKLKVVTAYGAATRYVDVELVEPEHESGSVQVDESLAQPQPAGDQGGLDGPLDDPTLPVLALGAVALGVAAAAALVVESDVVVLGALAVLAGVLVAVYFMVVT